MDLWQEYQAIYVHIPFCVQKCLYCDFASYANCSEDMKERYVEAVCREIAHPLSLPISPQATVYFGGGTPSVLSVEQLARIVTALQRAKLWREPQEVTIEVNPGTVDVVKLQALHELGFTRVSMGVQSLNDAELRTIGRIHTAAQALEALAWAREAGFAHINADVIYGLPGQTLPSLERTLAALTQTAIDHISVYGLIVEEGTPLAKLVASRHMLLPDEDASADMYDFVQAYLKEQGFLRYEVSNYARRAMTHQNNSSYQFKHRGESGYIDYSPNCKDDGDLVATGYSRHNDVYWQYLPYAALGSGAVSFDGQSRYTRPSMVPAYCAWGETLTDSCYDKIAEHLTQDELLSECLMMGLRRVQGVDLRAVQTRYGVDVLERHGEALKPYLEHGLVKYDAATQRLALTERGMAVGNQIFALFV